MAIVLPQGRFNNLTDEYLRRYIGAHARILAVVGLEINTFKPHTNTKTSVLFLQKWNDNEDYGPLCPYKEDYPIFFASSQKCGKDSTGEYVFLKDETDQVLRDLHGHPIVDHDLYSERLVIQKQWERILNSIQDPEIIAKYNKAYTRLLEILPQHPTIAEAFMDFVKDEGFSFLPEGQSHGNLE
ncbi:hypothetical protein SOV_52510 [Sporomusa ovata DSM 2662]|uniref:Type I restriction-modification enzyme M subunit n=1 Tax=Sporomusa ovata TaxID=2378 RepID=A0A0U1KSU1_9FIRM|nr:hypothetical protein SOV_2c05200 [Sporomusa ovata DSM 2662]CQR69973.1 Type I restriction-modification enzyme M subunit [Sporomusa ovata]